MIPPADVRLSIEEMRRWDFTRLAAALAASGISTDTILMDAREGIEIGRRNRADMGWTRRC